ncbi:MAG: type VI secretion system tip protein VgrG, partial [Phycisphaerae bacterium]
MLDPSGGQRRKRKVVDPFGCVCEEQQADGASLAGIALGGSGQDSNGGGEAADAGAEGSPPARCDARVSGATFQLGEHEGLRLDVLTFDGEEELSRLFRFEIEVAVEQDVVDLIDEAKLVGERASLTVHAEGGAAARCIRGLISECEFVGFGHSSAFYRFTLAPVVWPLTQRVNCRIFQDVSTPQIVACVLAQYGLTGEHVRFALKENYVPRNYCVQYRESDWDFLSRLMEEEGIYCFQREKRGKTVLQITDGPHGHVEAPLGRAAAFREPDGLTPQPGTVFRLRARRQVRAGQATLTDYAAVKPSMPLETKGVADARGVEVFDYPGEYRTRELGQRLAAVRSQELHTGRDQACGSSTRPDFAPGHVFDLGCHPVGRMNRALLITKVVHRGRTPMAAQLEYLGDGRSAGGQIEPSYVNEFQSMPAEQVFRPQRRTQRPRVGGPQTAVVTGAPGEEIHTDKYGRVKVQFRWDREGVKDDNSSCWIRVSQPWAGAGYGGLAIPRVGQEVIVDFLEGDPDQPIITGRVYNGEAMQPTSMAAPSRMTGKGLEPIPAMQSRPQVLPDTATRTTIRSNSTPGGGGANEFTMDDAAGAELFHLNATKDFVRTVTNDDTLTVGNNRKISIGNNLEEFVGVNRDRHVGADETVAVKANQSVTVDANRSITVKANESHTVQMCRAKQTMISENIVTGVSKTVETGLAHIETVGLLHTLLVGMQRLTAVGMNDDLIVGADKCDKIYGNFTTTVDNEMGISVGAKLVVECPDITLASKGGFIRIDGKGVTIKGTKVKINCSDAEAGKLSGTSTAAGG